MITTRLCVAVLALSAAASALADDCVDVAGQDHPRLQRYADSCLVAHEAKSFDSVTLPTGPIVSRGGERVPERSETVEGRTTRLLYFAPHGRSSLEVLRNYQRSLEQQGFEIAYECAAGDCDGGNGRHMMGAVYPSSRVFNSTSRHAASAFNYNVDDRRYLAARSADGSTWVGLFMAEATQLRLRDKQRVAVHIDVIEREAMEERMVDAREMANSIGESGSVTLENIYFETGSAKLTAQSGAALSETAKLLGDNPGLGLYIVGHTDSVGGYDANLVLSRRRAEAVAAALSASHGIASARVVPAGVGPLAPVASNASEDGRARNRRVELVAR